MAASATKHRNLCFAGPGGVRMETGTITFDSDATVEVETALSRILSVSFGATGSGGNANTLSIDETVAGNEVNVSGKVTVDATGSNSDTWFYTFIGY